MNVSFDIEFYFTKVLPPIYSYCTENPLTICRAKMRAAAALPENPRISHIQLAWMQAVTEFDFQAFDSIPPWDTNLIARVHALQESFRQILADAFISDLKKYDIKKELPLGEMDAGENVIYQILLPTAVQLLQTVLNQEKRDAETAKIYSNANFKKDEPKKIKEHKNQASKLSHYCNATTKNFYMAVERLLEENPEHELTSTALWKTLLIKKEDKTYKIESTQQISTRSWSITFISGDTINYHAAREHIEKVIIWFKSSKLLSY